MKMYWTDWRADPALRMCSPAARGIWADLLSLMHEADPYGYLLVKGRPVTPRGLSGLLGGSETDMIAHLEELRENGVFSETPEGVIYSRRMVRDAEKSDEGYGHGLRGGNPKLLDGDKGKTPKSPPKGKPPGITPPLTGGDNLTTIVTASTRATTRNQKPEKLKQQNQVSASGSPPPGSGQRPPTANGHDTKPPRQQYFEKLCTVVKLDPVKERANSAWLQFGGVMQDWIDRGCDAELDIWPALERVGMKYAATHRKLPQTPAYFVSAVLEARDQRLKSATVAITEPHFETHKWKNCLRVWRQDGGWNPDTWGPAPDQPGCFVPDALRILDDQEHRIQIHDPQNPGQLIRAYPNGKPYKPLPAVAPQAAAAQAAPQRARSPAPAGAPPTRSVLQMRLQSWRDDRYWPDDWGPSPAEDGCTLPPNMLLATDAKPDLDERAPLETDDDDDPIGDDDGLQHGEIPR